MVQGCDRSPTLPTPRQPPRPISSQSCEAHRAPVAESRHGEIELEIVIIDKHFPHDLVCPASRKLQGCCSKLSTQATDIVRLRGATAHSHKPCSAQSGKRRRARFVFSLWSCLKCVWSAGLFSRTKLGWNSFDKESLGNHLQSFDQGERKWLQKKTLAHQPFLFIHD